MYHRIRAATGFPMPDCPIVADLPQGKGYSKAISEQATSDSSLSEHRNERQRVWRSVHQPFGDLSIGADGRRSHSRRPAGLGVAPADNGVLFPQGWSGVLWR